MSEEVSSDVLFETVNNAGIITLNRPEALNSLNYNILSMLWSILHEWENTKNLVIIKGVGRSFCAGGDLKHVSETNKSNSSPEFTFAMLEYNVNNYIKHYKIPYIALLNGIAMGGGLGVSVHGRYRIATEHSVLAMPETKVGLIPDVGGSYFLPRLPYNIGVYLALTSNTLVGADSAIVGLATHYVPSTKLTELESDLSRCTSEYEIEHVLDRYHIKPTNFSLDPHVKTIDYCFAGKTVEDIISRLRRVDNDWSNKTISIIQERCPLAIKLTLETMHRGRTYTDLWQCLIMEYRIIWRLSLNQNFHEGVRALLIDKDKKPQWNPKTLAEVNEHEMLSFFEPLQMNRDLRPINYSKI
ncbi:hypothetical protein ACJJTC_014936 [Scirpophaga incertulas]